MQVEACAVDFDAIVVADDPLARVRVAGLTAQERAVRVARRVGATTVHVIETLADREKLAGWQGRAVLVIRADQLVHTGLVQPLIASAATGVAVEDLTGHYAGAWFTTAHDAQAAVAALAAGTSDADIASRFTTKVPHGPVARAPIATADQRRAAHKLLYRILIKPQDNAITRYLYRPVSFPLTRLLVWTPITPNQISYLVAALVALGCWITAHASMNLALLGTVIVLAASYLDCCDGEVARVKLLSSRFGAWIDTVVDELSSVGYTAAIGWHCHLAFGPRYFGDLGFDPWKVAIAVGVVTIVWSIYCIYYNIIVAVGSANSQDYVGRFEVVPTGPNTVKLAPTSSATTSKSWLATYAPNLVRRDFISWVAVALAALHWTQVAFILLVAGGVGTSIVVTVDHIELRTLRRSIIRRGLVLQAP
jgi:phosphatidylglycerophosphate synthase